MGKAWSGVVYAYTLQSTMITTTAAVELQEHSPLELLRQFSEAAQV